jgi:hypothetical protein
MNVIGENILRKVNPSDNTISYYLSGSIKNSVINSVKNNTPNRNTVKNSMRKKRVLAKSKVSTNEAEDTKDILSNIAKIDPILLSGKKVAYIGILTNVWDLNLSTKLNLGTFVNNNTRKKYFSNNVNIGKKNPEKNKIFLGEKGGSHLLNAVLTDLKNNYHFDAVVLHAAAKSLESYYQRFGFVPIGDKYNTVGSNKKVVFFESNNMKVYWDEDKAGRLMVKFL